MRCSNVMQIDHIVTAFTYAGFPRYNVHRMCHKRGSTLHKCDCISAAPSATIAVVSLLFKRVLTAHKALQIYILRKICVHRQSPHITKSYVRMNDSVWPVNGATNGIIIYWIDTRLDFVPALWDISLHQNYCAYAVDCVLLSWRAQSHTRNGTLQQQYDMCLCVRLRTRNRKQPEQLIDPNQFEDKKQFSMKQFLMQLCDSEKEQTIWRLSTIATAKVWDRAKESQKKKITANLIQLDKHKHTNCFVSYL